MTIEREKKEDINELLAVEHTRKKGKKLFYTIKPAECPVGLKFCYKCKTADKSEEHHKLLEELAVTLEKNKKDKPSINEAKLNEIIKEFKLERKEASPVDFYIYEDIKQCPYYKGKGLGNEEGILYVECSCVINSVRWILEDK